MLNKKLTELEVKVLALKYISNMPEAAIGHELGIENYERMIPLHLLLRGALRKLKTGYLSDFKKVLALKAPTVGSGA